MVAGDGDGVPLAGPLLGLTRALEEGWPPGLSSDAGQAAHPLSGSDLGQVILLPANKAWPALSWVPWPPSPCWSRDVGSRAGASAAAKELKPL